MARVDKRIQVAELQFHCGAHATSLGDVCHRVDDFKTVLAQALMVVCHLKDKKTVEVKQIFLLKWHRKFLGINGLCDKIIQQPGARLHLAAATHAKHHLAPELFAYGDFGDIVCKTIPAVCEYIGLETLQITRHT